MSKYIIGIDEVGRGPLAGPVGIGVVAVNKLELDKIDFSGLRDSKKMTEKQRGEWNEKLELMESENKIIKNVALVDNKYIDKEGIQDAIRVGIKIALEGLGDISESSKIYLDGGLRAPKKYTNQETVVQGDASIPVISMAAVLAKVLRDKKMVQYSKKFPNYGFEKHKGYGTKEHREGILRFGLSAIHRETYCRNLLS